MDEFVRVPPGEVDDPEEKAEDDRYFNEYVKLDRFSTSDVSSTRRLSSREATSALLVGIGSSYDVT